MSVRQIQKEEKLKGLLNAGFAPDQEKERLIHYFNNYNQQFSHCFKKNYGVGHILYSNPEFGKHKFFKVIFLQN